MKSFRTNLFSIKFDSEAQAAALERLKGKFEPKPYLESYKPLQITATAASYVFNLLSLATASGLLFLLLRQATGNDIAAGTITAVLLFLLEAAKRYTWSAVFKNYWQYSKLSGGLLAVSLLLFSISLCCSFFGAKKLYSTAAVVQTDSTSTRIIETLTAQIKGIDSDIKTAKKMKWNGKVTGEGQKALAALQEQKANIVTEITRQRQRQDSSTDLATESKQIEAWQVAIITAVAELLFLLCAGYIQYYDWRSFVELATDHSAPPAQYKPINTDSFNGHSATISNEIDQRQPIGFKLPGDDITKIVNENRTTTPAAKTKEARSCEHCQQAYIYNHRKQRFCSDLCRREAWQKKTGKVLRQF